MIPILVIEDEESHAELIRRAFEARGAQFRPTFAANLHQAWQSIAQCEPSLIITDLMLPDGRGSELLERDRAAAAWPVVLMTSRGDERAAVEAIKAGALDYVIKSETSFSAMPQLAERALREWRRILEHREAQEAVLEAFELNKQVISSLSQGLIVLDTQLRYVHWNQFMEKLSNVPASALIGQQPIDVFPFLKDWKFDEYMEQALTGKTVTSDDVEYIAPHHEKPVWLVSKFSPLHDSKGRISGVIIVTTDLTQRRYAEEAARQSEERLRMALAAAQVATWDWNVVTNEFLASESAPAMFGLEQLPSSHEEGIQMLHSADRENVGRAIAGALQDPKKGANYEIQFRFLRPDGELRWFETKGKVLHDEDGSPLRMLGTVLDVTERKRLEEQLFQSQKMEGMGRLAGGVAHDFNNLLTAILGYSSLAARKPPGEDVRSLLLGISQAAERGEALTRQLLAFARKQVIEPRVIDLDEVILRMDKLLRRIIGEDIELSTIPSPQRASVRIDPGQFEQILLNLAVNARDAMPNGGRLSIETRSVELNDADLALMAGLQVGRHVSIEITDTGTGMGPEVLEHIFEPFFTTKPDGKGTGLGLATCYGIVKQNQGHISVSSELGRGTLFRLLFPQRELLSEDAHPKQDIRTELPRGTETVLVVEDEPMVRTIATETLRLQGYRVLEASGGQEALQVSKAHVGSIELLLTDVVMPEMQGRELAVRLRLQRPALPVLYTSGYVEGKPLSAAEMGQSAWFLQKPFTLSALTKKVREILDDPGYS